MGLTEVAHMAGNVALIYDGAGRRVAARILRADEPGAARADMVFCEANLDPICDLSGDVRAGATLHPARAEWTCGAAGEPKLRARPATDGDAATVRGIYALAAQAGPCFVRARRADWDALIAMWRERGWRVWLIESDVRALGYAVLGDDGCAGDCLYEFAAVPDGGPALDTALMAAHAAGACGARVAIRGSALVVRDN